jgi:SAM-dependent methyltransferase
MYASHTFDFIYAGSVFTHLNEQFQLAWLRELKRISKPGALLIISIHGPYVHESLPRSDQDHLSENGFLFKTGSTGTFKLDGLPDYYQSAYHTKSYIQREWADLFEVIAYAERGINRHQDAVILRNGS